MAGQRIHKLAAEWGVKSKDILDRLKRMGMDGKKAQSSLSEAEAARVYEEMGLGAAEAEPEPTRRMVEIRGNLSDEITAYDTITERRVRRGVVLRRTRRTEVDPAGLTGVPRLEVTAGIHAATAVNLTPEVLCSLAPNEFAYAATPAVEAGPPTTAPLIVDPASSPVTVENGHDSVAALEIESASADPASLQSEVEPRQVVPPDVAAGAGASPDHETERENPPVEEPDKLAAELLSHAQAAEQARLEREQAEADAAAAAKAAEIAKAEAEAEALAAAEAQEEKPSGPKVLGRIDLKRKTEPVLPEQPKGVDDGKPAEAGAGEDQKPGRKKKRKVVRKEDMFDAFEKSFQMRQRRPMKKRVSPGQKVAKTELTVPKASKRIVRINEVTSPGELAKMLGVKAGEVLGVLMRLGAMKSINDVLDLDTTTLVCEEFGFTVENTAVNVEELLQVVTPGEQSTAGSLPRPPVVTVMGHVDHGKTSLLDVIRESNVVSGEAGGITQHIGAYMVTTEQGDICFLDTPGHAAFTEMRARGASVTDIVILVVAADDGVMPQTIEAINHAKAASIPLVVAVNKIDRPDANPDRIKQQLSDHGVQPEDWGGDTQFVEVSAIEKTGIDKLLDAVVLVAQLLELKATVDRPACGAVIEARLDKGRGPVATVLVQEGTLKPGDYFVVGKTTGRVRAMMDHAGRQVSAATPSHAVELIGLDGVPLAGDTFDVVEDLSRAQQVADHRHHATKQQAAASARMSLEDLQQQLAAGEISELKAVIKADVHGSVEALKQALERLSNDEVKLNVIHHGVGAISETDVQLAAASRAIVLGFHVRPEAKARVLAEREGVDMRLHTIIYEVIDEVKAGLEGMLAPAFKEAIAGRAEVRDTFQVPGGVTIAGSYVREGKITRNSQCRLLRDNVVIHTGTISSLRRFKDDAREVQTGYECGIGIDRYNDVKVGDVIECFRMDEIKRTLADAEKASAAKAAAAESSEKENDG